jgi:class 3 adenylate cyclase
MNIMANDLRKLLENAKGTTQHIIAIVIDIRGFTPFCKEIGESLDIANFLKRIYIRIIDEYFPKASFYKPTGDGLLIVIPYDETSPKDTVAKTIDKCLSLMRDFGKLHDGDDMIYFPTPEKIGIGISRGTACCITSDETIVDYSGKVLNLASRLNDLARPSGIVFDASLGFNLVPKEVQESFRDEKVYVRGIAENKPITVYFTKQYTLIPSSRKEPFNQPKWNIVRVPEKFIDLKTSCQSGLGLYALFLPIKPLDEKQITVEISLNLRGRYIYVLLDTSSKGVHFTARGLKYSIDIDYPMLVESLKQRGEIGRAHV